MSHDGPVDFPKLTPDRATSALQTGGTAALTVAAGAYDWRLGAAVLGLLLTGYGLLRDLLTPAVDAEEDDE